MSPAGSRPDDEDVEPLLADLDRAGRYQRSVLAEARALPPDPTEERLVASLPPGTAWSGRRTRRVLVTTLAAAALLVFAWLARRAPDPGARGTDEVLGGALVLVEPLGAVPALGSFRWQPAERASWYVVVVFDADPDSAPGAEIDRSPELEDTRWQVPPERWKRWPRAIRWEVRPFDAGGRPGPSASGRALLSP